MDYEFALKLISDSCDESKSAIISPLSISCALGMTLLGTKNETADQIRHFIFKDFNEQKIHEHFSNILTDLKNDSEIDIVNNAYLTEDFSVLDSYKIAMKNFYNGKYEHVDFKKSYETANEINYDIAVATNQKIQNVVNSDSFNEKTQLLIINAITFEKMWKFPFKLEQLKDLFYSTPSISAEIDNLTIRAFYQYLHTPEYQAIVVPYLDKTFSMIIVLPEDRFGLSSLLKNTDISQMMNVLKEERNKFGFVKIPKFKAESSFELIMKLQNLGITDAFDQWKADFSKLCNTAPSLHVSGISHQAIIEVSETGTKATAATKVKGEMGCASIDPPLEFTFYANHPFLYLILDERKNIYFIGTFFN